MLDMWNLRMEMKDTGKVATVSHYTHECCSEHSTTATIATFPERPTWKHVFICFLSFTMHTGHILQAIRLMNTLHHSLCQVLWCWGLALWPTALNTTSCLAYNTVTTNSVHLSRKKFICPPNTVAFHPFPQIYAVLLFSITMI